MQTKRWNKELSINQEFRLHNSKKKTSKSTSQVPASAASTAKVGLLLSCGSRLPYILWMSDSFMYSWAAAKGNQKPDKMRGGEETLLIHMCNILYVHTKCPIFTVRNPENGTHLLWLVLIHKAHSQSKQTRTHSAASQTADKLSHKAASVRFCYHLWSDENSC